MTAVTELFADVVGQPAAVAVLREMARHPVHAYLFTGPSGTGKEEAARSFAASLLCERSGCGSCWHCRAVLDERHPDVVVLERSGAAITVDQARQVSQLAVRSPSVAKRIVVVLPDFHLVDEAAPALLKTIEEPPSSTVFIVIADHITARLVTVASRCVVVEFRSLPESLVADQLIAEGVEPARARELAVLSGGRLDRARRGVCDPDVIVRYEQWRSVPERIDGTGSAVATIVDDLLSSIDASLEFIKAEQERDSDAARSAEEEGVSGPSRSDLAQRHRRELRRCRTEELRFGLAALSGALRDRCLVAAGGDAVGDEEGHVVPVSAVGDHHISPRAIPEWIEAIRMIDEASRSLDRNPNEALLLQALLVRLSAGAGR